jgi:hypothetical protein
MPVKNYQNVYFCHFPLPVPRGTLNIAAKTQKHKNPPKYVYENFQLNCIDLI